MGPDEMLGALQHDGVDVRRESDRGALQMLTEKQARLQVGEFSPSALIEYLQESEEAAIADGFGGLQFAANMTLLLETGADHESLIEYEALLDRFVARGRSTVFCHYLRSRFDPALIHDVFRAHQMVILGDLVGSSPYYEPPDLLLGALKTEAADYKRKRVDWWIGRLRRALEAEDERETTREQLTQQEVERQRLVHQLGERLKEARTLHGALRLLRPEREVSWDLLSELAALLPGGWQYPEICEALVACGDLKAATMGWRESPWVQSVEFDTPRGPGRISVAYMEERPPENEGPFLAEERALLAGIAEKLQAYLKYQSAIVELRDREEFINLLLNSTAEAICAIDLKGNCAIANPACARLLGYDDPEELVGLNMHNEFHHTRADGAPFPSEDCPIHHDCIRGQAAHMDGDVFWRADGRQIEVDVYSHPIIKEGANIGAVVTFMDIGARKRLESQLVQAQKMEAVGQLAGGVAHDFNNLLTVINGYTELLMDSADREDPKYGLLDEIRKAGEHSASLTRQLLAFSRKQVLAPRLIDLNEVIRGTEKMLKRLIGEDVSLTTALSPDLMSVHADPAQIEQVLLNLAVNSRDAMPQGGKLTIETRNVAIDEAYARTHPDARLGPHVMIAVSDTGVGMGPEVKRHLFEPFFTTKGLGRGTGLGLAVVHGIVKQSGGHIEVYSETSLGTSFKIYLPYRAGVDSTESESEAVSEGHGSGETILVVEDDEAVRMLTTRILNEAGYRVLESCCGAEALRVCEEYAETIHLLVTDVVMPEIGGRLLAEKLLSRHPEMRVLYVSGYTDDAVVRHGILQDDVNFLQKPFAPVVLRRKVREVLQ